MHILIIEDETVIALSIEDALRTCLDDTFSLAVSEEGAVAAAILRKPDLITADVQLAPGSGVRAVETICANEAIPFVFITGTAEEAHCRFPDSAVVQKPFTVSELRAAVRLTTAHAG